MENSGLGLAIKDYNEEDCFNRISDFDKDKFMEANKIEDSHLWHFSKNAEEIYKFTYGKDIYSKSLAKPKEEKQGLCILHCLSNALHKDFFYLFSMFKGNKVIELSFFTENCLLHRFNYSLIQPILLNAITEDENLVVERTVSNGFHFFINGYLNKKNYLQRGELRNFFNSFETDVKVEKDEVYFPFVLGTQNSVPHRQLLLLEYIDGEIKYYLVDSIYDKVKIFNDIDNVLSFLYHTTNGIIDISVLIEFEEKIKDFNFEHIV